MFIGKAKAVWFDMFCGRRLVIVCKNFIRFVTGKSLPYLLEITRR